jgi:hypothetical protein
VYADDIAFIQGMPSLQQGVTTFLCAGAYAQPSTSSHHRRRTTRHRSRTSSARVGPPVVRRVFELLEAVFTATSSWWSSKTLTSRLHHESAYLSLPHKVRISDASFGAMYLRGLPYTFDSCNMAADIRRNVAASAFVLSCAITKITNVT